VEKYGLTDNDAKTLVANKVISDFFDSCLSHYNAPKPTANLIIGEVLRRVSLGEIDLDSFNLSAKDFANLVEMSETGKISKGDAKKIFRIMVENGGEPMSIAKSEGFLIEIDIAKVETVIASVLENNPTPVSQFCGGDKKVFGLLMGLCNKELKGAATPAVVKEYLEKSLSGITIATESTEIKAEETAANDVKIKQTNKIKYKAFSPEDIEIGKTVTISACVHSVRQHGKLTFIDVRTSRYVVQCVASVKTGVKEGMFVQIEGIIRSESRAPLGIEIEISDISLIHNPKTDYPLHVSKKNLDCNIDTNLDNRSVSLRNPEQRAIFKLSESICNGFREFMLSQDFTEIHSPKIVAQGAEGGANVFDLDYFGKHAFLNQSPQFYKQTAVAFFDRVFEIAPVYRAEKHATSRHINEYIGLDFEMGFINSMDEVMDMEEEMLKYLFDYLPKFYQNEINILGAEIPHIDKIPRITLLEGKEILAEKGSGNKLDLEPEDEVNLCNYAKSQFGSDFIFVTHFPSSKPPFYAMDSREDSRLAYKFDLLFRGLEITSGGQRIHDYDEQVAKMKRQGLDIEDFKYYLEAHKYGLPPHGGLGIGLERLVMKLLKLDNIRLCSMFPRDINRLLP
jgi:nondiscriminating aspartyl-tRNA synthetase